MSWVQIYPGGQGPAEHWCFVSSVEWLVPIPKQFSHPVTPSLLEGSGDIFLDGDLKFSSLCERLQEGKRGGEW